jgi:restriction system protein
VLPFKADWVHFLTFWMLDEVKRDHARKNTARLAKHTRTLAQIANQQRDWDAWDAKRQKHQAAAARRKHCWEAAGTAWQQAHQKDVARYEALKACYEANEEEGVARYFHLNLSAVPLPSWCPNLDGVYYDATSRVLLIDAKLPHFRSMMIVKGRVLKSGVQQVPATQKEAKDFANRFVFLSILRLLWEAVQLDQCKLFQLVCYNGSVSYDDPATGRHRQDVIVSIAAKPDEIEPLLLDRLDPEACFRRLRGMAAPRLSEVVPIAPVIQFNREDSRFIDGKEVLSSLPNTNLATIEWQEFEHLIRELFEKEFAANGAEVRVTQASRDRGVDAIVFDPDPIRGGTIVIQAKRYVNTVDLSAVRDLFGTVNAEGANKGILVTTSNFGPDAYAFCRGKPLTLLSGANLLSLLEKHGYRAHIDLAKAREILRSK